MWKKLDLEGMYQYKKDGGKGKTEVFAIDVDLFEQNLKRMTLAEVQSKMPFKCAEDRESEGFSFLKRARDSKGSAINVVSENTGKLTFAVFKDMTDAQESAEGLYDAYEMPQEEGRAEKNKAAHEKLAEKEPPADLMLRAVKDLVIHQDDLLLAFNDADAICRHANFSLKVLETALQKRFNFPITVYLQGSQPAFGPADETGGMPVWYFLFQIDQINSNKIYNLSGYEKLQKEFDEWIKK